jgi:hypothetical protein
MADSFVKRAFARCKNVHGGVQYEATPCLGCLDALTEEDEAGWADGVEYNLAFKAFYHGLCGWGFCATSDRTKDYVEAGIELRTAIEAGAQEERLLEIINTEPEELTRRRAARRLEVAIEGEETT